VVPDWLPHGVMVTEVVTELVTDTVAPATNTGLVFV
jgi:hypothetical protein